MFERAEVRSIEVLIPSNYRGTYNPEKAAESLRRVYRKASVIVDFEVDRLWVELRINGMTLGDFQAIENTVEQVLDLNAEKENENETLTILSQQS